MRRTPPFAKLARRGIAVALAVIVTTATALAAANGSASAKADGGEAAPPAAAGQAAAVSQGGAATSSKRAVRGRPNYGDLVRKWHAPPSVPAPRSASGLPMLVLEVINTGERVELTALTAQGGFSLIDLERASHALRDPRADDEHPVDPRLLDLAYRVQCHFAARSVRVISAFRLPHGRSNHGRGRALDLVVPGTSDEQVARYVRTLGFVGVGLYTRSGFVHVDSRPRSYFWVDGSAPGQRARHRPVLAALAARVDRDALAKGETPPAKDDDQSHDGENEAQGERAKNAGEQLTSPARYTDGMPRAP